MKKLKFKGDVYLFNEIWKLHSSGKILFATGEVEDVDTSDKFNITELKDYRAKYAGEISEGLKDLSDPTSLRKKLKAERDRLRLKELEEMYEQGDITPDELKQLIKLKYNSKEVNETMSYEHYAFLNLGIEPPSLTDGELGKFYKIMLKMTHKANSLLKTKNIQSNPISISEISELLNISKPNAYKYLKKLKKNNITKTFSMGDKEYMAINPKYAINGRITAQTYFIFKDEMNELFPNIPEEVIKLWEYEFINSTISLDK